MEETLSLQDQALGYATQAFDIAVAWLTSPPAIAQFAMIVGAFILAWIFSARAKPILTRLITPPPGQMPVVAGIRNFFLIFLPLLFPLFAYAFLAAGEATVQSMFGSSEVIAFGKRAALFVALRALVRDIITAPLPKALGKFIFLPLMALYVLGLLDDAQLFLTDTRVVLGNISFSLMAVLRGIIAGGVLIWIGRWSNGHSAEFIGKQQEMTPATRTLATKAVELAIFGLVFLLVMNIVGINLSSLAVLSGAIGVGIGFGLQKIASNFISGVILLLEGQATVGDFVELDGGEAGTIVRMTARAAILETFDGRWIVVPNEDFITTRVVNYSDSGSANRYEAPFSVSYDTDINRVPAIVEAAVATHPEVLDKPYPPDCELRGFGDSGVDFALEFWVNGLDDGKNRFTSEVLFLIWNALKDNGIAIPYPHRVVEFKGQMPGTAPAPQS